MRIYLPGISFIQLSSGGEERGKASQCPLGLIEWKWQQKQVIKSNFYTEPNERKCFSLCLIVQNNTKHWKDRFFFKKLKLKLIDKTSVCLLSSSMIKCTSNYLNTFKINLICLLSSVFLILIFKTSQNENILRLLIMLGQL